MPEENEKLEYDLSVLKTELKKWMESELKKLELSMLSPNLALEKELEDLTKAVKVLMKDSHKHSGPK